MSIRESQILRLHPKMHTSALTWGEGGGILAFTDNLFCHEDMLVEQMQFQNEDVLMQDNSCSDKLSSQMLVYQPKLPFFGPDFDHLPIPTH